MKNLFWFRRDLRFADNNGLKNSLSKGPTACVFVFDSHILDKLTDKNDRRIQFIMESLEDLNQQLKKYDSNLYFLYGKPEEVLINFIQKFNFQNLYYNRDYEPYASQRDTHISSLCKKINVNVKNFKDSVIFEKNEVLKKDNTPYHVFTPYKNKWLENYFSENFNESNSDQLYKNLIKIDYPDVFCINKCFKTIGFSSVSDNLITGGETEAYRKLNDFSQKIEKYDTTRDFVNLNGTSNLSTYIRFGCLSIRDCVKFSLKSNENGPKTWLSELIWREFYSMILSVYPKSSTSCFKDVYEKVIWEKDDKRLKAWIDGKTGFPIIDAGMRCLKKTGTLHNRLRMIVSSFFCKTLCLDWRLGEQYFARKLLDYDMASNVGGWQWSSSTGCDAAPYFRIFNPWSQSQKFDSDAMFIKKWVPELINIPAKAIHDPLRLKESLVTTYGITHNVYMSPIVDYKLQRQVALEMYKKVKDV